ncbi:hypothetical protein AB0L14_39550 [Streptomyces sp. NPDC052727]|uniref:hypothetical protein n=1 Tax=Streptomyces sp. NPDC052727 TaxID=3154854 RepID=UPI00341EA780
MGIEPFPAASAATDPMSRTSDTTPAHGRFAMPHALVIATCIVIAAILAPRAMTVGDVLALIAGDGGIGAAIVIAVVTGSRRVGRLGRLMRAYLTSGN